MRKVRGRLSWLPALSRCEHVRKSGFSNHSNISINETGECLFFESHRVFSSPQEFPGPVSGRFPRRFGRRDAEEWDPSAVLRHLPLR